MEIFLMNMQVLDARRDLSGGYKVVVTRGERASASAAFRQSGFRVSMMSGSSRSATWPGRSAAGPASWKRR
jgi:hypothetical protein